MDQIPLELIQEIFFDLDSLSQIRFRCSNKLFYEKLHIHDFDDIPYKYQDKLSDEILSLYPFIRKLKVHSSAINNLNSMTNLQILNFIICDSYTDDHISNLNLLDLDVGFHRSIRNIIHMTNLTKLNADGCCKITDVELANLNLIELSAMDNRNITNISHMDKLRILDASGLCGINDKGISAYPKGAAGPFGAPADLNLTKLRVTDNPKITDIHIRHMTSLQILHAGYDSAITDAGIANLNLIELFSCGNKKITKR